MRIFGLLMITTASSSTSLQFLPSQPNVLGNHDRRTTTFSATTEQSLAAATAVTDAYVYLDDDIYVTVANPDGIVVPSGVTNLVIDGRGMHKIDGGGQRRCLWVKVGSLVTLTNVVVTNGYNSQGAGIKNEGSLTIISSIISKNISNGGGGIFNKGVLTITTTTITSNTVNFGFGGGGINTEGPLTMTASTISNNHAYGGGGIYIYQATVEVVVRLVSCIISGNSAGVGATSQGGGISSNGSLILVANKFIGNIARDGSDVGTYTNAAQVAGSLSNPKVIVLSACPANQFNVGTGAANCFGTPGCTTPTFPSDLLTPSCGAVATGQYSCCGAIAASAVQPTCSSVQTQICSICPAGQASPVGFGACASCSVGSYAPYLGTLACALCSAGTYMASIGATVCTACNAGHFSAEVGAVASTTCQVCPSGLSSLLGQSMCSSSCPAGASSSVSGSCVSCPQGKFSASAGAISCTDCNNGKYSALTGGISCFACSSGLYSPYAAAACLSACLSGYFTFSTNSCLKCSAGYYSASTGSAYCDICSQGRISAAGATFCGLDCPAGTYVQGAVCLSCALGTFSSAANTTGSCIDCSRGYFAATTGSSGCSACDAGLSSLARSQACTSCSLGTFSAMVGSVCTDCDPGRFSSLEGAIACVSCPAGKANAASRSAVSSSCSTCGPGSYSSNGATECGTCPGGLYSATEGAVNCVSCPGTVNPARTSCSCPPGTGLSSSVCTECLSGSFSLGSETCQYCPEGSYSSVKGSTFCTLCSAGAYSFNLGNTQCTSCGAGSFGVAIGASNSTTCLSCPLGTFQKMSASASCLSCDAGTYSGVGAPNCSQCSSGKISGSNAVACAACSAGLYSASAGSSLCQNCDAGTYSGVGATSCSQCSSGKISGSNAVACAACSAGLYSASAGSSLCQNCDAGTYSGVGATSCGECSLGKISGSNAVACAACSAGLYTASTSSSSCQSCPLGRTSDVGSFTCPLASSNRYLNVESPYSPSVQDLSCPANCECAGGTATPRPILGFWISHEELKYAAKVYKCRRLTCLGAAQTADSCWNRTHFSENEICRSLALTCADGAFGPMCGACRSGYTYSSSSLTCTRCGRDMVVSLVILSALAVIVFFSGAVLYSNWKSARRFMEESWFVGAIRQVDSGAVKVVLSTYQIAASVSWTLGVDWPSVFQEFLRALSFLSFDFLSLDCVIQDSNAYSTAYLWCAAPAGISCLLGLGCLVRIYLNDATAISDHAYWFLGFTYAVLPAVSLHLLRSLDCEMVAGHNVLVADTSIDCDSSESRTFRVVDAMFMALYLSIPLLWLVLLYQRRIDLNPHTNDMRLKYFLRDRNAALKPIRFLYYDFQPPYYYFEVIEMFRRIFLIGVLPLVSAAPAKRAAVGVFVSLCTLLAYREVEPFRLPSNNFLFFIAQCALLLVYASALIISTDVGQGLEPLTLGCILIAAILAVLGLSCYIALLRFWNHRARELTMKNKRATKLEWAVGWQAEKFQTTFVAVENAYVAPSHCLAFWYCSRDSAERALRRGIPATESFGGGIILSLHRPHELDDVDASFFPERDAVLVSSFPRKLLMALPECKHGFYIRQFPGSALKALRSSSFDLNVVFDAEAWYEGNLFLPPKQIMRAFQLEESDKRSLASGNHMVRGILSDENRPTCPNIRIETPETCAKYVSEMISIRSQCSAQNRVPVYHFTTVANGRLIAETGFRMSTQGQGDGGQISSVDGCASGVYFTVRGPASYDLGSKAYEENLIVDCFGASRLSEYKGRNLLDLCIVYSIDPTCLTQAPGGRHNAFMVSKDLFEKAALPDKESNFFLRPDRIMAMFCLGPTIPSGFDSTETELSGERENDERVKELVLATLRELDDNDNQVRKLLRSGHGEPGNRLMKEWGHRARGVTSSEFELQEVFGRHRAGSSLPWTRSAHNPMVESGATGI